jgi:hypothetical protein
MATGGEGNTTILDDALLNALLVLSIAEMDFKIINCHARPWGVEFARAVMTADARKILVFDLLAG